MLIVAAAQTGLAAPESYQKHRTLLHAAAPVPCRNDAPFAPKDDPGRGPKKIPQTIPQRIGKVRTASHSARLLPDPTAPVVVFGGAGFIGTHLLARLRDDGLKNLISVDIRAPARPIKGVDYRRHDIRDLSGLSVGTAVPTAVPLVFNLAAVHTTPGHAPWEYYDANVRGAVEITRFARRHATTQIVFTSSISVYGPNEIPKDEATPPTPNSDYGRSKLLAEQVHKDWLAESHDRKLVISRPAVVFGLGEGGNFTRLARMLNMGWFVYPGRKDTIKSCIYVRDLVDWLLVAAATRDQGFILFNGTYKERYTIEQIVTTFQQVAFNKARTVMLPAGVLKALAGVLRPISVTGLGVHPERIEKLMISTNILPRWADEQGLPTSERLRKSLEDWKTQSGGQFL